MKDKYLITRTANETLRYASTLPNPKRLFDEFWLEGEICILYSDTNTGKSSLAVNIADSISKGIPIPGFKLDTTSKKVVYFDFELSEKQFQARYSDNYCNLYRFSDNLLRTEINYDYEGEFSLKAIRNSIEESIEESCAEVIILDNLTFLINKVEKSDETASFMKDLKRLKQKYNVSMLIIAHTPKRDKTRPIDDTDLQGSRMIANFMDSSFAIGCSLTDDSIKYLKQIKARSVEKLYTAENVVVCTLQKDNNYLRFVFNGNANEYELIKPPTPDDEAELVSQIINLVENEKMSYREVGRQLNINHMKVKRRYEKHKL